MKYTDEQLSRILSVAAVGELGDAADGHPDGLTWQNENGYEYHGACIDQAAYVSWDPQPIKYVGHWKEWDARAGDPPTTDDLLVWLEGKGFA